MTDIRRSCRQFFRHHWEALSIVAFILAAFLLSDWALYLATFAAILIVCAPRVRQFISLPPAGQTAYLKAFVKIPAVQRLAILVFAAHSVRYLVNSDRQRQPNIKTRSSTNLRKHRPSTRIARESLELGFTESSV